jgi:hypothetical protein
VPAKAAEVEGWWARRPVDPATVPILYWIYGAVFLTPQAPTGGESRVSDRRRVPTPPQIERLTRTSTAAPVSSSTAGTLGPLGADQGAAHVAGPVSAAVVEVLAAAPAIIGSDYWTCTFWSIGGSMPVDDCDG